MSLPKLLLNIKKQGLDFFGAYEYRAGPGNCPAEKLASRHLDFFGDLQGYGSLNGPPNKEELAALFHSFCRPGDGNKSVIPILLSLSHTGDMAVEQEAKLMEQNTRRYMDTYLPGVPWIAWTHGDHRGEGDRGLHTHILAARRDPGTGKCHRFSPEKMKEMQDCRWGINVTTARGTTQRGPPTQWQAAKEKVIEKRDKALDIVAAIVAQEGLQALTKSGKIKIKMFSKNGKLLVQPSFSFCPRDGAKPVTWRLIPLREIAKTSPLLRTLIDCIEAAKPILDAAALARIAGKKGENKNQIDPDNQPQKI